MAPAQVAWVLWKRVVCGDSHLGDESIANAGLQDSSGYAEVLQKSVILCAYIAQRMASTETLHLDKW